VQIHQIQKEILKELSFADSLTFGDFKIKTTIEQDLFNYHLQALVKLGYLIKNNLKKYSLTIKGKEVIQYMDVTKKMADMRMPKVAVQIFVLKEDKVLLSKRMRHPFKSYIGFASGKVEWGEDSETTMKREAVEELGITPIKYSLHAIKRCIDYDRSGAVAIHDAVYYIYLVTEFKGITVNTEESENKWYHIKNIHALKLLPVTELILKSYKNKRILTPFYETITTKSLNL